MKRLEILGISDEENTEQTVSQIQRSLPTICYGQTKKTLTNQPENKRTNKKTHPKNPPPNKKKHHTKKPPKQTNDNLKK